MIYVEVHKSVLIYFNKVQVSSTKREHGNEVKQWECRCITLIRWTHVNWKWHIVPTRDHVQRVLLTNYAYPLTAAASKDRLCSLEDFRFGWYMTNLIPSVPDLEYSMHDEVDKNTTPFCSGSEGVAMGGSPLWRFPRY